MTTVDSPPAPSGAQLRIAGGGYGAVVASVGAAVRVLRHADRDVFVPFDEHAVMHRFHGSLLAPWPNRISDGRYAVHGEQQQLPLTEPERGHALHGLVTWVDFAVVRHDADAVELETRIVPRLGYPFAVDVRVAYRVDEQGLRTTVTATNRSADAAPFGTGAHPWIAVAAGLAGATLHSPATTMLEVEAERMLPGALVPTPAWADFRVARPVGDARIDHAFSGLVADERGASTIRIVGDDGRGAALTVDADVSWLQVCTSDWADEHHRAAIAIEPMTCGPDAFSRGGAAMLARDEPRSWSWTYAAIEAGEG